MGFYRDFLFVSINNQIYDLYYGDPNFELPNSLRFLSRLDYMTLYYLKYPLTLLYILLYFLTTIFAVKYLTVNKKIRLWVVYIYTLLIILSGISMAWGYLVNHRLTDDEYTFSRWLMGILQSPLVAFFLIASSSLYKSIQKKQNNEKGYSDL